ncbi:MAG TPA: hypothetical protein VLI07_18800 [Candidatus Binatus sp.]|nr:hypothetical protein [Candidatus Binatus sp.]
MNPELELAEKHALAREFGGALCFISDWDPDDTADIGVLRLLEGPEGIGLLRFTNPYTDFVIRIRLEDLDWLIENGPLGNPESPDYSP